MVAAKWNLCQMKVEWGDWSLSQVSGPAYTVFFDGNYIEALPVALTSTL